jgi:uncharacterized membrane protein
MFNFIHARAVDACMSFAIIDVILAIISFIASIGAITSKTTDTVNATSVHAIMFK